MIVPRSISIVSAAGFALLAAVVGAVGGCLVGLGAMEAIADSFKAVKWEERPSKALTVAALGETAVLRDLAVTPLRVKETLEAAFEDTPLGGRELRLWFRIESRSDGPAIIPFPKEVSLFGSLRDELGNEMWSHGFRVRTVEETERTDAIGQGESVAKAVSRTPAPRPAKSSAKSRLHVSSQAGGSCRTVSANAASESPGTWIGRSVAGVSSTGRVPSRSASSMTRSLTS